MKIITGRKGKKNGVHALSVIVVDRYAVSTRQMQFSLVGTTGVEAAFDIVFEGTRKEIELRGRKK